MERVPNTAVVGEQRGDEAKGAVIDRIAHEYDMVARFGGGQNAGHTVYHEGKLLALHGVPSGIAHPDIVNVIGNGTLMDAAKLADEIESLRADGLTITPENLKISSAAHMVLPHHQILDALIEGSDKAQGSTKSGIAPAAADKYARQGIRFEAILKDNTLLGGAVWGGLDSILQTYRSQEEIAKIDGGLAIWNRLQLHGEEIAVTYMKKALKLAEFITDTQVYLNQELKDGKSLLAEGAQAFLLDIDHGMYPYVTSTGTTAGAVPQGLGVPADTIQRVIGVVKATQSHVGDGPFVTEIFDQGRLNVLVGQAGEIDAERGTTTGRIRRMGHLDLPGIRRAHMINGTHEMALSKLDCVPRYGRAALICVGYEFDGKKIDIAPPSAEELERCQPVYEELPTWDEDIQGVRDFTQLPENARRYIRFIEEQTNVPITMIGVGPSRDQFITRK